jgi:hypothetical protein
MSALIGVSNLTNFQEFSTGSRKPVDNPAPLGASQNMRKGSWGGRIPDVQPPQAFS